MSFAIERLASHHDKRGFFCGISALDDYLKERASQDARRLVANCLVAVDVEKDRLAGYYTLAASGVALNEMPPALARKLPRYSLVPVARVGRLVVDVHYQNQRLGKALLWDAVARAQRSEMAAFALAVDAKDERAAAFYLHHGFIRLDNTKQLLLPLMGFTA